MERRVFIIWQFTKDHISKWFPNMPSYQAFNHRLNFLAPVLHSLAQTWLEAISVTSRDSNSYAVDSCPVLLTACSHSSHAKVASEICSKSYNAARKEWYYGVKLHTFVARHSGKLPTPCAHLRLVFFYTLFYN